MLELDIQLSIYELNILLLFSMDHETYSHRPTIEDVMTKGLPTAAFEDSRTSLCGSCMGTRRREAAD
jgi:hypothetical protein